MYTTVAQLRAVSRLGRLDSEYYAFPRLADMERYLQASVDWVPLGRAAPGIATGHTPLRHDLTEGSVPFLTIECVEPLTVHVDRSGRVTRSHAEKELKRVILREDDVLITIKRRIAYAAPVTPDAVGAVVNQDIAVAKPMKDFLPGYLAAVLVSEVGRLQALRLQTEQINPYLSVPLLKRIMIPRLKDGDQRAIQDLVNARTSLFTLAAGNESRARQVLETAVRLAIPTSSQTRILGLSEVLANRRFDAEFVCGTRLEEAWPDAVPWTTLGDPSITVRMSSGATPAAMEYADAGTPIFKVGGLSRFGTADWLGDFVEPKSQAARARRSRVQPGDVLVLAAAHHVSYIGKSGFIVRWPTDQASARAVGELIILSPGASISPEVLSSYLNLSPVRRDIQRRVRGQSAHLYTSDIADIRVPLVQPKVREEIKALFAEAAEARFRAVDALAEIKLEVEGRVAALS